VPPLSSNEQPLITSVHTTVSNLHGSRTCVECERTSGELHMGMGTRRGRQQQEQIRIDVSAHGRPRLTTKMTNGAGGYEPGHILQNSTSTLTRDQTEWFLGKIEDNKFWKLSAVDKTRMGLDGGQWIIEGVKDGNYHIVDRWSPEGGPVRTIGLLMLHKLAKVKIPGPTY
jgi:hypothetical protein